MRHGLSGKLPDMESTPVSSSAATGSGRGLKRFSQTPGLEADIPEETTPKKVKQEDLPKKQSLESDKITAIVDNEHAEAAIEAARVALQKAKDAQYQGEFVRLVGTRMCTLTALLSHAKNEGCC